VRAGVRLSLDQQAQGLDRSAPFHRWSQVGTQLLQKAATQNELLPHVNPAQSAHTLVGAFAGIQAMSQAITNYQDLPTQVTTLLQHTLPSITTPPVLATLSNTPQRGAQLHHQLAAAQIASTA
ncbi:TetR/AcrR family transcriptional regulator, partial [Streptomyces sp. NPDC127072]